jgi:outer membrane immunogenic protein
LGDGDEEVAVGGNALGALGMAAPALAADMPAKMLLKAPAPVPFTWTGCYIGGQAGYGWGSKDFSDPTAGGPFGGTVNDKVKGWLAGGQAGCNYQVSNWVFGVEGDAAWANINGLAADPFFTGKNVQTAQAKVNFLADITGRLGVAWDRVLVYGKGGAAIAHDSYDVIFPFLFSTPGTVDFSSSEDRAGWVAGAGVEWAFAQSWSAKAEYLHYDFGGGNLALTNGAGGTLNTRVDQKIHTVKFGINFHFWAGH